MNIKRLSLLFICIFFIIYGCSISLYSTGANVDETFKQEFQQELDELRQTEGFPGVTAGIVLPDGQSMSFASGLADIEAKVKMNPLDRMLSGSIGKTYAAAVALQLIKEKKFSLEDKISLFFKNEKWFSRLPNAQNITVKMLMNHTGGLTRYVFKKNLWTQLKQYPDKVWTPEERIGFILDDKPIHPAGEGWAYSDTDYILVGMIIEKVTGHTYYEELNKRILQPHGLKFTSPSDSRRLQGLVSGYTGDGSPPFELPGKMLQDGVYMINPQFEWTGGGLITNSTDLAKYIKLLIEGKIIPREYLELMKKAVNPKTGKPGSFGYGLGLEVYQTTDGVTYGHRGIMPGYLSIMEYVPQYKFSAALQINCDQFSGKLINKKTRNDYLTALKPIIIKYLSNKK
jgi:D-alanyl-D-alanine carboxypeptidase